MRANYPEAYAYLKAKKARHPKDDAIEDFTQWTVRARGTAATSFPAAFATRNNSTAALSPFSRCRSFSANQCPRSRKSCGQARSRRPSPRCARRSAWTTATRAAIERKIPTACTALLVRVAKREAKPPQPVRHPAVVVLTRRGGVTRRCVAGGGRDEKGGDGGGVHCAAVRGVHAQVALVEAPRQRWLLHDWRRRRRRRRLPGVVTCWWSCCYLDARYRCAVVGRIRRRVVVLCARPHRVAVLHAAARQQAIPRVGSGRSLRATRATGR